MECIVTECKHRAKGLEAGGQLMCTQHSRDARVYWRHRPCLACLSVEHAVGECVLLQGPHSLVCCDKTGRFPTPAFSADFAVQMQLLLDNKHEDLEHTVGLEHTMHIETRVSLHTDKNAQHNVIAWCIFPPSQQPQQLDLCVGGDDASQSISAARVPHIQQPWWACNITSLYYTTIQTRRHKTTQEIRKQGIQQATWEITTTTNTNGQGHETVIKHQLELPDLQNIKSHKPPEGSFPERFRNYLTTNCTSLDTQEQSVTSAQRFLCGMRAGPSFVYEALLSTASQYCKCVSCGWVHIMLHRNTTPEKHKQNKCAECATTTKATHARLAVQCHPKHESNALMSSNEVRASNRVAVVFSFYHAMSANPIHYEATRSCLKQLAVFAQTLYSLQLRSGVSRGKWNLQITDNRIDHENYACIKSSMIIARQEAKLTTDKDKNINQSLYSVFAFLELTLFESLPLATQPPHAADASCIWPQLESQLVHTDKLVTYMLTHHNNLAVALMTVLSLRGNEIATHVEVLVQTHTPPKSKEQKNQYATSNPMLPTTKHPSSNRAMRMHANIFTKRDQDILLACVGTEESKTVTSGILPHPPHTPKQQQHTDKCEAARYATPLNRLTNALNNKYPRLLDLLGSRLQGSLRCPGSTWSARRGTLPATGNQVILPETGQVVRLEHSSMETLPPDVILDKAEIAKCGFTNATVSTNDYILMTTIRKGSKSVGLYWVATETPTLNVNTYQKNDPIFLILATHNQLTQDLFTGCANICAENHGQLVYGSLDVTKEIFATVSQNLANFLYTHDHATTAQPRNTVVYQTEFNPQRMQRLCQRYDCTEFPALIILDTTGFKSTPSFGVRTITTDGMRFLKQTPGHAGHIPHLLAAVPTHAFEHPHKPRSEPRWVDVLTGTHIIENELIPD